MKNYYLLSLISLLSLINGEKKDKSTDDQGFSYQAVQLCVFNNYNIKFSTRNFFSEDHLGDIRYWVSIMRGIVGTKLLNFLDEYTFLIIREERSTEKNITTTDQKIKKELQHLMTNVNYDGVDNLLPFVEELNGKSNQILEYEILPLRIKTLEEKQEVELYKEKLNSEELLIKYGLFPNITPDKKQKHLMTKCRNCSKIEIREILQSMKINSSQIVYLRSRDRYVYIKLLKVSEFLPMPRNILSYFYLKYGLSLLKNDKKTQREYFSKLLHDFFCR